MFHPAPFHRFCLGCIDIKTAAIIITLITLLNKLPGVFGILSFDFGDPVAVTMFLYSVPATVIVAYSLNGVLKEHLPTVRFYALFYWADLFINILFTVMLTFIWFGLTDHSTDLSVKGVSDDDDAVTSVDEIELEMEMAWKWEGLLSVAMLLLMWGIRTYFAIVIWQYHDLLARRRLPFGSPTGSSYGRSSQDDTSEDVEDDFRPLDKSNTRRDGYSSVEVLVTRD